MDRRRGRAPSGRARRTRRTARAARRSSAASARTCGRSRSGTRRSARRTVYPTLALGDSSARHSANRASATATHPAAVRIAIVTDYYYPQLGGITEHVHGQATHLQRARPRGDGHHRQPLPPAGRRRRRVPRRGRTSPFEILRMGQALRLYGNASQTLHTLDFRMIAKLKRLFRERALRRHPHARAVQPGLRDARAVRGAALGDHLSARSTPSSRRGRCSTSSAA